MAERTFMKFDIGVVCYNLSTYYNSVWNDTTKDTSGEDLHAFLSAEVTWVGNPHAASIDMVSLTAFIRVVTLYGVVGRHQRFAGTYCDSVTSIYKSYKALASLQSTFIALSCFLPPSSWRWVEAVSTSETPVGFYEPTICSIPEGRR